MSEEAHVEPLNPGLHTIRDIFASVKNEYVIAKEDFVNLVKFKTDSTNSIKAPVNNNIEPTNNKTLKKRHFESYPTKENRLCSFIIRDEICPYSSSCQYSHDPIEYLSIKGIYY